MKQNSELNLSHETCLFKKLQKKKKKSGSDFWIIIVFRYKLHNKVLKGKVFSCHAATQAVSKFQTCESGRSSQASMTQRKKGSGICDSDKHFNAGDRGKQKDPTACDVSKRSIWE